MNSYPGITIQGQILSTDILENIAYEQKNYQTSSDFGLDDSVYLKGEIQFAYSLARKQWESFTKRKERIAEDEPGTSETRRYWMLPLLDALGYNPEVSNAEYIDGRSYAISHRDNALEGFPIHIMGINDNMDKRRTEGGPRMSPHGLIQEYLNVTEHLFGLVTNGRKLRLLRDSTRLSRLSFIEFDLEGMMEDERYPDFAMMFRLIHASRMPAKPEEAANSIIEQYHQDAVESGTRIRDGLRTAVEEAIRCLGNGFLKHVGNEELREEVLSGQVTPNSYYADLLQIIYRLLFLMVIEERKLVFPALRDVKDPDTLEANRSIYYNYYSINRLRNLAEKRHTLDPQAEDLWENLKQTFLLFEKEVFGAKLGIQALGGSLFNPSDLEILKDSKLKNQDLLQALDFIGRFQDENRNMVRVNYEALDVEELGSVYEALLDYQPKFQTSTDTDQFKDFGFYFSEGTERKTTGSYYTRPELVQELIKSALVPVMEQKLKGKKTLKEQEQAILGMKICDPASGSGHFLLAAARKMGVRLATIRTGEDNPAPTDYNMAVRDVIGHCIYGVDKNPMAVQLCKVSLWLESYAQGYPLSFLDHHIKQGDSLVGLDDLKRLNHGIPDGAYNEVLGDEKEVADKLKTRNRKERKRGKQTELQESAGSKEIALERFADRLNEIDAMPERTIEETQRKKEAYVNFKETRAYQQAVKASNIWTGSFFVEKTEKNVSKKVIPTTSGLHSYIANPKAVYSPLLAEMDAISVDQHFFHWPLEYPEVFTKDGFDVVLGNPPWENIQPEETKFFATKKPELANLPGDSRKQAIKELKKEKHPVHSLWIKHKKDIKRVVHFTKEGGRNKLTARGKINTYRLFSDLNRALLNNKGRTGMIVPTGIATDNTSKYFFGDNVEQKAILSLFDFENREALFEGVHRSYKFCLLTLGGTDYKNREVEADFAFFLTHPNQLDDEIRRFKLSPEDLKRINPNTKTTPIFRTQPDAEITRKIYKKLPVLIRYEYDENGKKVGEKNPWGVSFRQGLFNMTSDSNLFHDEPAPNRLPLYEAKLIWHYDHRFATFEEQADGSLETRDVTIEEKQDPEYSITPRYWVDEKEVWVRLTKVPKDVAEAWMLGDIEELEKYVAWWIWGEGYEGVSGSEWLRKLELNDKELIPSTKKEIREAQKLSKQLKLQWKDLETIEEQGLLDGVELIIKNYIPEWLMGFRDVTNATNERTSIFSVIPRNGVGHTAPLVLFKVMSLYLCKNRMGAV